ncbi:MAG: glycosyltransferase family A protein [Bacteroidales bacterium]|nr:glycosyltransferase family A protein [Bacteroidales bacterium]
MPGVSVVIPVFNSAQYITACVRSLLVQTMDSLELVFVDDHGQDNAMDVVRQCLQDYVGPKTFRFVKTPVNSGPGAARNVGIQASSGEYLCFVDSDDTLTPDFCESLYTAATQAGAELCCCDIMIGRQTYENPDPSDKRQFLRHFVSYFTTFLYKKALLVENGIFFPPTRSAEDTCFLTACILASNRIVHIKGAKYHYRLNPNSVSRKRSRQRASQRLSSFRHLSRFVRSHGLLRPYCVELTWLFLKKGLAMSLRDLIVG